MHRVFGSFVALRFDSGKRLSPDKVCWITISFEHTHKMFFFNRFQLLCAAMSLSSLEKSSYAALFMALWVVTSVMQNLVCMCAFPVDAGFQRTIVLSMYRNVQEWKHVVFFFFYGEFYAFEHVVEGLVYGVDVSCFNNCENIINVSDP